MWGTVKISDVCEFQSGLWKGKKGPFTNANVIRNTNFRPKGNLSYENIAFLKVETKELSKRQLQHGDIILEKSGGGEKTPVGRVCLFEKQDDKVPFSLSNFTCFIRVKEPSILDYKYLHKFLYFMYEAGKTEPMQRNSTGIRNLQLKEYKDISIPLPPIAEQQHIVAKLDAAFAEIDNAISLRQKSLKNLDTFFKNQLNRIYIDNRDNWDETTLGRYYDVRDGTHDSPKYVKIGIPLVTSKNLKKGKIDLTKIKYIKNEDYLLIKKRSGVSIGDVLMAMIGTIGNAAIVKKDNNFAIKNVALFKLKENQSSDFLKFYLDSPFVVNKMMKNAKGTTQQFVGLGYLRNFPIKVPSFEEQKKITLKIINLEKNIETLKNKYDSIIDNYYSLKNSLLIKLLNKNKAA